MSYSILYGLVLGILTMVFLKKNLYHGPDSNIIRNNIYYDIKTNTCFQLIPTLCDSR